MKNNSEMTQKLIEEAFKIMRENGITNRTTGLLIAQALNRGCIIGLEEGRKIIRGI